VGAISGAEYEARLAALRGTTEETATADSPFATFLSGINDNIADILEWCGETYDLLINPIIEAFQPLVDIFNDIFSPEFFTSMEDLFAPVGDDIQSLFSDIGEALADIVGIFIDFFTSDAGQALISSLVEIGASLIAETLNLIKDALIIILSFITLFSPASSPEERAAAYQAIFDAFMAILQNPVFRAILNTLAVFFRGIIMALTILIGIFNPLAALIVAAMTLPSFATGTGNVPKDMVAQLHQGEMVVPKTFAEDMRSGMFPGGSGTNNVTNEFNIFVEGDVVTERGIVQAFSTEAKKLQKQGYLGR
jgi:hypothetical protein